MPYQAVEVENKMWNSFVPEDALINHVDLAPDGCY
jgi:hypothetical protein